MLALLIAELFLLYLLSRSLKLGLYRLVFLVTKSRRVPISILALLFFPGTVIHELAHWIVAETLRVPTGAITLHPVIEHSGQVRMGSVEIARVDPIRRSLVGLAPIVVGLILLLASSQLFLPAIPRGYILFTIGNMMFSSRRDLEGLWALLILIILITSGAFVLNLYPSYAGLQPEGLTEQLRWVDTETNRSFFSISALIPQTIFAKSEMIARLLSTPLAILVGIDLVFLGLIHGGLYLGQKVLKRKLVN